jgi:hypothetical protein
MNKKIAILIAALIGGIILSLALASVVSSIKLKKYGVKIEATVLSKKSNKGLNTVTVLFNASDGTEVTAKAAKRNYVKTGDKVTIWYDPAFPQKIDFGDTVGYNMRGVLIGAFLIILMIYFFIKYSISDKAKKDLIRSGMKIAADFVSIDRDERFRAGDRNPWIIKCKWVDSRNNQEYYFVSKEYTIDPAPYLNGRYHVDVFIDPADPGKYYMDTSFMPKGNNTIG